MRTFKKKPKATQQTTSAKSPKLDRSFVSQRRAVNSILHLQQTIGNQAIVRLFQAVPENIDASSPSSKSTRFAYDFNRIPVEATAVSIIQPKLRANAPKDRYEQEADRVADQVLRQRIPEQDKPPKGVIQSKASQQAAEGEGGREVNEDLGSRLSRRKGGGNFMSGQVRAFVESRMQYDFSKVRVHTDNEAARMNKELGARAFTHDWDIYFGVGQYSPLSIEGKRLLAHELTHVVQQTGGAKSREADHVQGEQPKSVWGVQFSRPGFVSLRQTIQPSTVGNVVQLAQHPAAARQSRAMVATSSQSFLTSYSRQLTQRFLLQLRDRRRSVAAAVSTTSEGTRTFGARPAAATEPGRTALGMPAEATGAPTRRAVVVGNGSYNQSATMGSTVLPLRGRDIATAVSDAATVATALQGRGYDVGPLHQDNQTAVQIGTLLQAGLSGLGAGDELLFYYHGHGTMEGLIGRDGSIYTPVQMAAIRSAARGAQVNLTLVLEGCHTGVFADAVRGAELRDTLAAMRTRIGVTSGVVRYARQLLLPVLDNAIAIQAQKDAFNTQTQAWWARRYQIEQQMAASPGDATVEAAWNTHYQRLQGIWNDLVTALMPLLSTMRTNAIAAGFNIELSPQITQLSGTFDQDGEYAIQAGLDDLDTILNRVLQETDSRLR
jgi:hypothetical protein